MSEYRTVYPDRGNEKFVAEALLAVADDPSQVQVDSRPHPDRKSGPGFRVPVEVYERFSSMMVAKSDDVAEEKSEPVKPVKKAGRPKKAEEAE